jgi:hypothetical protein
VIIYLVSAPGHEITGYGDGLIDGRHPDLLVSYLEYMGNKLRPLNGFRRSRLLDHPCYGRCQYAVDLEVASASCPRNQCYYDKHFPELSQRNAVILERCGEPEGVNADLLGGA